MRVPRSANQLEENLVFPHAEGIFIKAHVLNEIPVLGVLLRNVAEFRRSKGTKATPSLVSFISRPSSPDASLASSRLILSLLSDYISPGAFPCSFYSLCRNISRFDFMTAIYREIRVIRLNRLPRARTRHARRAKSLSSELQSPADIRSPCTCWVR